MKEMENQFNINLKKLLKYKNYKQFILHCFFSFKIVDIAVCTHPKNDRNRFELVLKDWSYIIQVYSMRFLEKRFS